MNLKDFGNAATNLIAKDLRKRFQDYLVGSSPISKKTFQVAEDPELTFKPKLIKGKRGHEVKLGEISHS